MKLEWSTGAREDLRPIADFIATDNPRLARDWIHKLQVRARRAAKYPHSGRKVPEYERDDYREILVGHYRIIYRVNPTRIVVVGVYEGHRRLPTVSDG